MIRHARPRDFSQSDVPLSWDADGMLHDPRRGRTYVTFARPVPGSPAPPEPPPPPIPAAPHVPAVRQAFDAVALTSIITGLALLLRITLRF